MGPNEERGTQTPQGRIRMALMAHFVDVNSLEKFLQAVGIHF